MIPKRVELENFLSFGEKQVIDFTTDDEALWILCGPNGVGKSAVFDAITYCLFGQHRGGKDGAASLIRHGQNGFRLNFEFEFNGADYRILRTRSRTTTQRVEQKDAAGWNAIPGVNSVTEVENWVDRTLGLGFVAFTTSVLLRQGEADAIVSATGTDRLKILKRIIDVERFERLSERVQKARKTRETELKLLGTQRAAAKPVTDEELQAARDALAQAEAGRTAAQAASATAAERVNLAKHWMKLEEDWKRLDGQIRNAAALAAEAEQLGQAKARLDDLASAIPILQNFAEVRDRIAALGKTLGDRQAEVGKLTSEVEALTSTIDDSRKKAEAHRTAEVEHGREVKRLGEEVEREAKFLTTAESVAKLSAEFAQFAPDLAANLKAVQERVRGAEEAATATGNLATELSALLRLAKKQQEEFAKVGVGAKCSRCRQPVDEKHAALERADLAREVAALTEKSDAAERAATEANDEKTAARVHCNAIAGDVQKRDALEVRKADQARTLKQFGIHADPRELQRQLDEKKAAAEVHAEREKDESFKSKAAANDAIRLEGQRSERAKTLENLAAQIRTDSEGLAEDRGQRETLHAQLSEPWKARCEALTASDIAELDSERKTLVSSKIAERFEQLQRSKALHDEWVNQRDGLEIQIDGIPVEARVPANEAERLALTARNAASAAEKTRDAANNQADALAAQAEAFRTLLATIATVEKSVDIHRTLDDLLGKHGIQRELVRDAEREIVRFANDTVKNLSGGNLEIELEKSEDDEEAFPLVVRQADVAMPTPVRFLSGSEKFRVAVAIAVAIGKFAAGPSAARPLESVIIDEGFGSLDPSNLQAMREELENLKESQSLKRIILVSHQESFTSSFPVGYQLTPGENGTIAERFRREV